MDNKQTTRKAEKKGRGKLAEDAHRPAFRTFSLINNKDKPGPLFHILAWMGRRP